MGRLKMYLSLGNQFFAFFVGFLFKRGERGTRDNDSPRPNTLIKLRSGQRQEEGIDRSGPRQDCKDQGKAPADGLSSVFCESTTEHILAPIPYVRSFYFLGKIHEERGEMDEARKYYRRFVEFWGDGDLDRDPVEEARMMDCDVCGCGYGWPGWVPCWVG